MNCKLASDRVQRATRGYHCGVIVLCVALMLPAPFSEAGHAGESKSYSAPPHEGRIIDSHSQKPLPDVIVTISWRLSSESSFNAPPFVVMETITDKDGHFSFPGWAPKAALAGAVVNPVTPELIFFRLDYDFLHLKDKLARREDGDSILTSEWEGKTVAMTPPKKDMVVRAGPRIISRQSARLRGLISILSWAYTGRECEWKKTPRLMRAIHQRARELNTQGIPDPYTMVSELIPPPGAPDPCGARSFFEKDVK